MASPRLRCACVLVMPAATVGEAGYSCDGTPCRAAGRGSRGGGGDLGGSRATGAAVEGSDWDFGLYYRGGLDPADITALGWPGRVFAPGEWGSIVNGGAWLTIGGARVDLIYRDLDEVLRWTAAAGEGRFEIRREVGYVAGIATYILAGELGLGKVLAGHLPRPAFPPRLLQTAPEAWFR